MTKQVSNLEDLMTQLYSEELIETLDYEEQGLSEWYTAVVLKPFRMARFQFKAGDVLEHGTKFLNEWSTGNNLSRNGKLIFTDYVDYENFDWQKALTALSN
jgi:hypothetical protein